MLCAIIGYGPGLGAAYAEVFGQAGYDVALLSRSGGGETSSDRSGAVVRAFRCDAGDPGNLQSVLQAVEDELGSIDVAIYNADLAQFGTLDEITEDQFEQTWRVGTLGLFATAKFLAPRMESRAAGAIIVTGATAALRGNIWTTAFASSKSAQRNLAQSLAKQLGPKGIHVAYLVIDGVIDTTDTRTHFAPNEPDEFFMDPKAIAETALMLVGQDKSAWTFEIDLRPFQEKW
ncbi:MAG: SDR family NAD(P)-dependent oxidoreductase [Boseongicola sp.]|nr:MAG: SDR family NAD(P)-dependent oxidoreductase [Boseongicola sp.]